MRYKNIDLIHQGSLPLDLRDKDCISRISRGAPNYSGLEAFPFVGKPDRVFTKKGEVMNYDTHGLPRSIPFIFNGAVKDAVYFYQTHDGKTKISNIKFKESGKGPESLDAIFPYTLNKGFYGVRNVQKDTDGRYLGAQMKDYYSLNITPFEE